MVRDADYYLRLESISKRRRSTGLASNTHETNTLERCALVSFPKLGEPNCDSPHLGEHWL